MRKSIFLSSAILLLMHFSSKAQCPAGQSEVFIDVHTDMYGYEIYWELVPSGNGCGNGTIFSGGNSLVGCGGGSAQAQNPGGYGDMITINEGPWCLTDNADYDIIFVDDWGDGGAEFNVKIAGYPMYHWDDGDGANAGSVFTFTVELPMAIDVEGDQLISDLYVQLGNNELKGTLFNMGMDTIQTMDLNYQIDNDPVVTSNLTGLTFDPFTVYNFAHPILWNITTNGTYTIKVWASNINGSADMNMMNDTITRVVEAGPGIPNIMDNYIGAGYQPTIIAGSTDGILVPRDLDFHPILTRNELWVILKSTENSGGKTVKISNAGLGSQTELVQQDGNAWHFMSLPTGIAFSGNSNFATSPGVFDANHDGGSPFTGPTLWSSDPLIYAQPSGGNGSHLDMLHESPYSMGICSETENAFWVVDGDSYCVTYYDFKTDHGPGNSYHGDGIVRKYFGNTLAVDPAHHVASHLVRDKNSDWLYVVDTGNDKIVRIDVTTGTVASTFTPMEMTAESSIMNGFTEEDFITTGLTEPSGIDIIEDRMVVSDHSTGDIIIYDISGTTGVEVERIVTGTPGIMGVKIGPDGKIWYVNATTNQVVRLEQAPASVNENITDDISILVYPNPAKEMLNINTNISGDYSISIIDVSGKQVMQSTVSQFHSAIDISMLSEGTYFVQVNNRVKKFTVVR